MLFENVKVINQERISSMPYDAAKIWTDVQNICIKETVAQYKVVSFVGEQNADQGTNFVYIVEMIIEDTRHLIFVVANRDNEETTIVQTEYIA